MFGKQRPTTSKPTATVDGDDTDGSGGDTPGPALPDNYKDSRIRRPAGAAVPSIQDLELRQEAARENESLQHTDLRYERKMQKAQEKVRFEELVPRAEPGTKERQLEKKREVASTNRAFAAAKTEGGGVVEIPDSELLGDNDDGVDDYKRRKKEMERKKSEREIRKEEVMRARTAEREERTRAYKEKEEKTMKGLIELAKQRFG